MKQQTRLQLDNFFSQVEDLSLQAIQNGIPINIIHRNLAQCRIFIIIRAINFILLQYVRQPILRSYKMAIVFINGNDPMIFRINSKTYACIYPQTANRVTLPIKNQNQTFTCILFFFITNIQSINMARGRSDISKKHTWVVLVDF